MVARGKPAPDLFLYAAERMQVDPHRTLVIEDSVSGVKAGKAAGMSVLEHLEDLVARGAVATDRPTSIEARYRLA